MAAKKPVQIPEEPALPEVVNLTGSQVEKVSAELVRAQRSLIGSLEAGEVELQQSGAGQVSAETVTAHNALIGSVQTGALTLTGSAGVLRAQEAVLNGPTGIVAAGEATLASEASAGILAARSVRAEKVRTAVLLAQHVEGPVETLLDTRRVLLASATAGLAAGAVLLIGRLLFKRKE